MKIGFKSYFISLITLFLIASGIGISYMTPTNNNKWLVPTNDSAFQKIKTGLIPWILVILFVNIYKQQQGKISELNFLQNRISSSFGFYSYIIAYMTFYYIWVLALDKDNDDFYTKGTYTISIIIGMSVWITTSNLIISKRLDNIIFSSMVILVTVWFISCSYNECPDLYR